MAWTHIVWQFLSRIAISNVVCGCRVTAGAWDYHEHREMAAPAVSDLEPMAGLS